MSSSEIAIAIMISSGQISKMSIIFSVQQLFVLDKIIFIQLIGAQKVHVELWFINFGFNFF